MNIQSILRNNKGFGGLIGLLITVALISLAAYFIFNKYFSKPTGMDQTTQGMIEGAGMDTSSQTGAYQSAKAKIAQIQDLQQQQSDQLSNASGQ